MHCLIGCETGGGDGGLRADCATGGGFGDRALDGPAPGVVLCLLLRLVRHDSSIARRMFCASSSSSSCPTLVVGTLSICSSVLSNPSVQPQL